MQAEKAAEVMQLTMQVATLQSESTTKVQALESTVTELKSHKEEANFKVSQQLQRVTELESNASTLQSLVTQSEIKV